MLVEADQIQVTERLLSHLQNNRPDVDAIYEAASKFNASGSAVTRYARELRDKLRKIIAHVEASIPFDVDHRGEARMATDRASVEKGGDGGDDDGQQWDY